MLLNFLLFAKEPNWSCLLYMYVSCCEINAVKSNPINSSLEQSSIYKYGELCYIIEHPLKPKAFHSSAI